MLSNPKFDNPEFGWFHGLKRLLKPHSSFRAATQTTTLRQANVTSRITHVSLEPSYSWSTSSKHDQLQSPAKTNDLDRYVFIESFRVFWNYTKITEDSSPVLCGRVTEEPRSTFYLEATRNWSQRFKARRRKIDHNDMILHVFTNSRIAKWAAISSLDLHLLNLRLWFWNFTSEPQKTLPLNLCFWGRSMFGSRQRTCRIMRHKDWLRGSSQLPAVLTDDCYTFNHTYTFFFSMKRLLSCFKLTGS